MLYVKYYVREKGPSVCPPGLTHARMEVNVCLHLQDFSVMIPICVYSFVVCGVCVCVHMCAYVCVYAHGTAGSSEKTKPV